MYDIIGDIHGHSAQLVALLGKLGYDQRDGVYRHPERQVIFLGDFIDRGPEIKRVVEIARTMVMAGSALAVMGNHEFNALAYHTPDPQCPGEYLRRRSPKNTHQHEQTLRQLDEDAMRSALDWFKTLPLYLDLPGLRVVHACWDAELLATIEAGMKSHSGVTTDFLIASTSKGAPLYHAVDAVLKGKEIRLPVGISFKDKDGHDRADMRCRWYTPPDGKTYYQYALPSESLMPERLLEPSVVASAKPYPIDAKPVFFGHYWLNDAKPEILADNVACVDYSVAKQGFLCAYRWSGERKLTNASFVWE
jgi:hypothetical protein